MAKEEKKEVKGKKEKKGGSKFLIIIIALLILVIIGGAGAFYFLYSAPSDEEVAKEIKKDETPQEIVAPSPDSIGVVVDLKPFLVNLADPNARHFLKATISLSVKDDEAKSLVEKFLPKIRNDVLLLLSSKTLEDVITIEGKVRLKDEIMSRVSRIIGPGRLKDVYFSQFVVQ